MFVVPLVAFLGYRYVKNKRMNQSQRNAQPNTQPTPAPQGHPVQPMQAQQVQMVAPGQVVAQVPVAHAVAVPIQGQMPVAHAQPVRQPVAHAQPVQGIVMAGVVA